jgi:hypothetical protein
MHEHLVQHTASERRNPYFGCKQNNCYPVFPDNAATLILIARRDGESSSRRTPGADLGGGRTPVWEAEERRNRNAHLEFELFFPKIGTQEFQ